MIATIGILLIIIRRNLYNNQRYIRYGSQTNKYMLKVENRKTRKRSDYCSNLKHQSDILDVFLDFLWLPLNIFQIFF